MKQKRFKTPLVTINRLSIYYRYLESLKETEEGRNLETISSRKISIATGVNPAQVRKDLAYFGEFGKRGIGYPVIDLGKELRNILGLNKEWPVVIAGAGNLGKALAYYPGLEKRGFLVKGIFDNDPKKIGKRFNNIFIYSVEDMEKYICEWNTRIGILTVPANFAQNIADKMILGGIKSILNFAPVYLKLSHGVRIQNIDVSIELEGLTYYLNS